ncbi:hypothetical protein IU449_27270 [Nocardia higoensis]|uniref:Uncharacterized protein n=1 Tax=Nocardia higoensis TaxID=228599 RepID=A0ABS0DKY3_9NOCA|nr:hypothetical protein [Nocardia higoensis]MBF6358202.1 hypothetical protein [Nocardia higoensis]
MDPIYMVAPDRRRVLVGTAVEREQLLARGYKVAAPELTPARKPTPATKPADTSKTTK